MSFDSHFARFLSYLKELNFQGLKADWKNEIVQSSFYLQSKSKTRLKPRIFGVNFISDLALVGKQGIAFCDTFSSK